MKLETNNNAYELMLIVCMFKVFHDSGITALERLYAKDHFDMDYFYDMVLEGLDYAAPIVYYDDNLYRKYGYPDCDDYCDVNIRAYSSEEMQECFKLARKLDRLDKGSKMPKKYEEHLESDIDNARTFYSYSFDWNMGNKRKGAQMEVLWGYDFTSDVALCIWIVRVMNMCKEKLPELQKAYRDARRIKRSMKSVMNGGAVCAA